MKRILATTLILVFTLVPLSFGAEVAGVDGEIHGIPNFLGYVSDRIVVNFDPAAASMMDKRAFPQGRTGIPTFDQLAERLGAHFIRAQFPGAQRKTYRGRVIDLSGWHKIEFANKVDVTAVVEAFKRIPGVIDAQPISIHTVYKEPIEQFYDWQWHLPKIQAPEAWDTATGNPEIIVAILDTGVRYFQKDLGGADASYSNPNIIGGNMWINTTEKEGVAGEDDDENGYVDDWIGWDFVERTQDSFFIYCYPNDFLELGEEGEDCDMADNDPRDFNGHGTHCAGIASAMNHNAEAVASIAGGWGDGTLEQFGNGVKIMPLRIGWSAVYLGLLEVGLVTMDYAAEALYYAAENGARIASCSWGSANDGGIAAAIDAFLASGGLIFKAAGNDGSETQDYMCEREDIIKVAATDPDDCIAYFSNYGAWVDVCAPGVEIWSLYHFHYDPEQDYVTAMDGTSMAAPLAAGVAALIWSQNPDLKASQVRQILYESADPLDSLPCNAPYAGKLGGGRINAYKALNTEPPPVPPEQFVNIAEFLVGKYEISGRGKNKTTSFIIQEDAFKAGDTVILRIRIRDKSSGQPVADATADIAITGPESIYVSTEPSDTDGVAYAEWKTEKRRGKSKAGGTSPGDYTATVTHVMADNYTWDGVSEDVSFTVQ